MKGVVKYGLGPQGVELRTLEDPKPKQGECLVKVLAAGICASDIHAIKDERSVTMPVVLGHEYIGQIAQTCGNTGSLKAGDWVVSLPACYSCGTCRECRSGAVTLCRQRKSIGSHRNGAMANLVVVPAKYTWKVASADADPAFLVPYAVAEPLACVVHGVYEKVDVRPGDVVVVSGPGVIGQLCAKAFRLRGAHVILSGIEIDREKLEFAKAVGNADVVVSNVADLEEVLKAISPGGADITCDCAGVVPSLDTCLRVIKPMGTHLQMGLFGGKVPFRLDGLFDREVTYVPANSSTVSSWKITLDLLRENRIDLSPYVSMKVGLEDWKAAFDAVINKKVYKALIMPNGIAADWKSEVFR